jgi:hypothetical protein
MMTLKTLLTRLGRILLLLGKTTSLVATPLMCGLARRHCPLCMSSLTARMSM